MKGPVVIGLVLVIYGLTEALGAYGLLAVFAAGFSFRRYEFDHQMHHAAHHAVEAAGKTLELLVLLMLGTMLTTGGLGAPGLAGWLLAPVLLLVIRPALVMGLVGHGLMSAAPAAVPGLLRRPRGGGAVLRRDRRGVPRAQRGGDPDRRLDDDRLRRGVDRGPRADGDAPDAALAAIMTGAVSSWSDGVVRILDEPWELGARLSDEERALATPAVRAHTLRWHGRTPGAIPAEAQQPGALGLLVLEGALGLRVRGGSVTRLELLGPGDLLRPWSNLESIVSEPPVPEWELYEPVRVAVLDREFTVATARWPEIVEALTNRLVLRSRQLVVQMTAAAQRRAEDRMLMMLQQLADRWGSVGPDGVRVRVPLTHRMLADMTGTSRPAASGAISRLRRAGMLATDADGRFVLLRAHASA